MAMVFSGGFSLQRLAEKIDKPGFKSSFDRSIGMQLQGLGQLAEDLGWEDNFIKRAGEEIVASNPSGINSLGDVVENPWLALKEAAGNVAGFLATAAVPGAGGRVLGLGRGAMLVAQAVNAGLPSYGSIRQRQIEQGNNSPSDMLTAGAGALAVGAIENALGAQNIPLLRKMLGLSKEVPEELVKKAAIEEIKSFGRTPFRSGLKAWAKAAGGEAFEEVLQNPIEQAASYTDPTSEESLKETALGAVMGGLGGLAAGGIGGVQAYSRHNVVANELSPYLIDPSKTTPVDLLQGLERMDSARETAVEPNEINQVRMYTDQQEIQPQQAELDLLSAIEGNDVVVSEVVNPYDVAGYVTAPFEIGSQQRNLFVPSDAEPNVDTQLLALWPQRQAELDFPPPIEGNDVVISGAINPYNAAGYVTMPFEIDGRQENLFGPNNKSVATETNAPVVQPQVQPLEQAKLDLANAQQRLDNLLANPKKTKSYTLQLNKARNDVAQLSKLVADLETPRAPKVRLPKYDITTEATVPPPAPGESPRAVVVLSQESAPPMQGELASVIKGQRGTVERVESDQHKQQSPLAAKSKASASVDEVRELVASIKDAINKLNTEKIFAKRADAESALIANLTSLMNIAQHGKARTAKQAVPRDVRVAQKALDLLTPVIPKHVWSKAEKRVAVINEPEVASVDKETINADKADKVRGKQKKLTTPKKRIRLTDIIEENDAYAEEDADVLRAQDDGVMFERGPSTSSKRSLTVTEVQAIVDVMRKHWQNAPEIIVANNMQDDLVPEIVKKQDADMRDAGATGDVEGFFYDGKVYLIASALKSERGAIRVLFHETLGHYGLRGVFGDSLKPILRAVAASKPKEIQAVAKVYGLDINKEADRLIAAEEVLAELAQTRPSLSFVQRAIAAIRTWLRKHLPGFKSLKFSDAEIIRDFILPARRFVENKQKGVTDNAAKPMFSRAAQEPSEAIIASLPKELQEPARILATNVHNLMTKGIYSLSFGHDLATMVSKHLSSARKYFDLIGKKAASKIHIEYKIDKIMERASKVKDKAALNEFLKRSTVTQKWGFKPDWKPEAVVDPEMEKAFKALSKEAQEVAVEIFRHGAETIELMRNLVREEINESFGKDVENLTEEQKKAIEAQRLRAMRLFDAKFSELQGPYAPLMRFGNYVVIAKSKAFLEATPEQQAKMESDDRHYYVAFFNSLGEAEAAARKLAPEFDGGEVIAKEKQFVTRELEAPWQALSRLQTMVKHEFGDDSKEARAIRSMLNDLYLSTLSETSARQFHNKRRNIAGASDDMLRAFASKGRADAHFIAALLHNREINETLADMAKEAKKSSEATRAFNEILRRHAVNMEYKDTPIQDKLASITSFWMLLTNPAYYTQNSTQTFMITLPWLAGRYGYYKSWNALLQAYRDTLKGNIDIDRMSISEDERKMLRELNDMGIIDIGITQDLGRWAAGDMPKGIRLVGEISDKLRLVAQKVEQVNRITSALAAYRLSKGDINAAATAIRVTHGDYSGFNAPRIFNMPGSKLILQFAKFRLIQLSLLARLVYQSFKGADATQRAIARKSLAFLLGHHFAMTGALGLPGIGPFGWVIAAALGEDDDPKNTEYLLRRAIGDEDLATLLLKGVPAALGIDVSKRLGMGEVISPLPFADSDPFSREGYKDWLMAASGAFLGGLLPSVFDGISLIRKGDTLRGMEMMLPAGLRNAIRSYRFATEGVTTRRGDVVLTPDEITFVDELLQALGLPTTTITEYYRKRSMDLEFKDYFRERASQIKRDYVKAYYEGDGEAMREAREAWVSLQQAKRRYIEYKGIKDKDFAPQPLSNLLKAPREQRKHQRKLQEKY